MAVKVSKNLRRLRKAQGKTQEQLAEALNVTRQAISNWENDKTQPDLNSLEALAQIFNVEIEELIYGEKRQVGTEVDPERASAKVRIILGVVGSVFIGVGLVLIFLNFWQDFPLPVQTAFSIVPMLVGQAFAVYVFFKRNEDLVWRESSAILWCIGVISTVALINSVFHIHCGFQNCLLIDIILCLPVFYLMRAVSPLLFYFYMVIHWSALSGSFWISSLLLAAGLFYVLLNRKQSEDVRYKYTVWISAIGTVAYILTQTVFVLTSMLTQVNGLSQGADLFSVVALMISPFLALYLLGQKDTDYSLPFQPLGVLGCAVLMTVLAAIVWMETPSLSRWDTDFTLIRELLQKLPSEFMGCILLLLLPLPTAAVRFRSFKENLPKILLSAFAYGAILCAVAVLVTCLYPLTWLWCVFAAGFAGVLIYKGIDEMKLMPANLGLLMLFAQIIFLLQSLELSPLVIGIIFLLFGVALIVLNYEMHTRKREAAALALAENQAEEDAQ